MKRFALVAMFAVSIGMTHDAWGDCVLNDGGDKSPFSGGSLSGVQVEKKSLVPLDKKFPALKVVEKAFKGEVQTCTSCSGKYVSCQ